MTQMDPAAAGRQIRTLEEDGLVMRTKDSDDGRVLSSGSLAKGAEVRSVWAGRGTPHGRRFADWSSEPTGSSWHILLPRFVGDCNAPFRGEADLEALR